MPQNKHRPKTGQANSASLLVENSDTLLGGLWTCHCRVLERTSNQTSWLKIMLEVVEVVRPILKFIITLEFTVDILT